MTDAIEEAVQNANAEIMMTGESSLDFHKMGTTIASVVIVGQTAYIAGVGDSRVYLMKGQTFEQMTEDHSISQALLDSSVISEEEAATHPLRNVLYRYLGTEEGGIDMVVQKRPLDSGDRFILCSDGVTEGVDDEMLATLLRENDDPQQAAQANVAL